MVLLALGCAAPSGQPEGAGPSMGEAAATAGELVSVYVVLRGPGAVEAALAADSPVSLRAIRLGRARLAELDRQHDAVRSALRAAGARPIADLKRLTNAIQIQVPSSQLPLLADLPEVERLEPVSTFFPVLASAVPTIGAPTLWGRSTPYTGTGIRIGVIDSGLDYTHADFGGSGDAADFAANDGSIIEPGSFPTERVIGGYDFAGDAYDPADSENSEPEPDPDPLDCDPRVAGGDAAGHGTHISGIVAGGGVLLDDSPYEGPYDLSLDWSAFRVAPGVAPEAQLYALKVFGCSGGTQLVAAALERAADPNEDGNFDDRLDIVNASIGTAYGLGSGVEAELLTHLTELGTLVVAAGGNDGATFFTVDAPGIHPAVLSVAASQTPDLLAVTIESPATIAGTIPAAEADFTRTLVDSGPLTGLVVYAQPPDGCGPLANAGAVGGRVALIDRGECTFSDKLTQASSAGAMAAVVVDDEEAELPIVMGGAEQVDIPGVFIRKVDGELIKSELGQGVVVTLDGSAVYQGLGSEMVAEFSSRGPSAVDTKLKPEVSAPGQSVDSARVGTGHESRRAHGTSVATPMVAGAAALLRQARPDWGPIDIKAAVMNTAVPLEDNQGQGFPISMAGAGRIDVAAAVDTEVTVGVDIADGSVGVSFGSLVLAAPESVSRRVRVRNRGATDQSYLAAANLAYPLDGVGVSVSPEAVGVPAGGTAEVTLTMVVDPERLGAPPPDPLTPTEQGGQPRHYLSEAAGYLQLYDTIHRPVLRLPFYGTVRAAAERAAGGQARCYVARQGGTVRLDVDGPSAHPAPVVTAFELGVLHPPRPGWSIEPTVALADVRAVGVASSYEVAASFAETELHFGVAISGEWTTAARGPFHQVGIVLDTDFDGEANYYVVADPLTRDGPYADVLLSVVYDGETGEQLEPKPYVNLVAANEHATNPFHNGVLVLSANAETLGLSEEQANFAYAAFSRSRDASIEHETTEWLEFDPTQPVIDTARRAPVAGKPIWGAGVPLLVSVDETAAGDAPLPALLLLHHSNVPGQRFETVSFGDLAVDALVLDHWASSSASPGGRWYAALEVINNTDHLLSNVTLDGGLAGGTIELVASSHGHCQRQGAVSCDLESLAPGAVAEISIQGRAAASLAAGEAAELAVTMSSPDGCDATLRRSMPVPSPAAGELPPGGGCGCRVERAQRQGTSHGGWMLGLLGLVATCRATPLRRGRRCGACPPRDRRRSSRAPRHLRS